jgi:hypothetical protein
MCGNTRYGFRGSRVQIGQAFENRANNVRLGGARLSRIERHGSGSDGAGKLLAPRRLSVPEIRVILGAPGQRYWPESEQSSPVQGTHDGLHLVSIQAYLNRGMDRRRYASDAASFRMRAAVSLSTFAWSTSRRNSRSPHPDPSSRPLKPAKKSAGSV